MFKILNESGIAETRTTEEAMFHGAAVMLVTSGTSTTMGVKKTTGTTFWGFAEKTKITGATVPDMDGASVIASGELVRVLKGDITALTTHFTATNVAMGRYVKAANGGLLIDDGATQTVDSVGIVEMYNPTSGVMKFTTIGIVDIT